MILGDNAGRAGFRRDRATDFTRPCNGFCDVPSIIYHGIHCFFDASGMISAGQLRAARALLGIDQRALADMAGLSLPTIQRMEASGGVIRGTVDSLTKLISALDNAGIELIGEGGPSYAAGRGVRLKGTAPRPTAGVGR
jgi:DNA-binding XRE family transcriptional regulator